MKKILAVLSFSVFVIACAHKTAPTGSGSTGTTGTTDKSTVTTTSNTDAATLQAGHTIYTTKCTKCHGDKGVSNYTATRWEGILKAMAPKAKLNETETAQVSAYVKANAKAGQP